jgi:hypothetical protein
LPFVILLFNKNFRLESGSPNLSFSKFYQNLQMLNCCIGHRLRYQTDTTTVTTTTTPTIVENQEEPDEDGDQFYECSSNIASSKSNFIDLPADGRLRQCGDLKLLNSNEILYIPVTQVIYDLVYSMIYITENLGMSTSNRGNA